MKFFHSHLSWWSTDLAPVIDSAPPVVEEKMPGPTQEIMPDAPASSRLKQFWLEMKKLSQEKIFSADVDNNQNQDVDFEKLLPKNVSFDKPLSIAPPATLREAKLSPWWPLYKIAIQAEYDGFLASNTFEKVLLKNVPKAKNILRGKWILSDKRGEDGKILKYKARFVAMGNTQKYLIV